MKLKSNELRIGNYVFDDEGLISQVQHLESKEFNNWNGTGEEMIKFTVQRDGVFHWVFGSDVFGIEITEEWLLKFGFVKQGVGNGVLRQTMFWYKGLRFDEIMRGKRYRLKLGGDPLQDINIDFVHDLQNIVFALKKVELEVTI